MCYGCLQPSIWCCASPFVVTITAKLRRPIISYIVRWLANFFTDRTKAVVTQAGASVNLATIRSIVQGPISFVAYIGD